MWFSDVPDFKTSLGHLFKDVLQTHVSGLVAIKHWWRYLFLVSNFLAKQFEKTIILKLKYENTKYTRVCNSLPVHLKQIKSETNLSNQQNLHDFVHLIHLWASLLKGFSQCIRQHSENEFEVNIKNPRPLH